MDKAPLEAQGAERKYKNKPSWRKWAIEEYCIYFNCWKWSMLCVHPLGPANSPYRLCDCLLTDRARQLRGTHRSKVVTDSYMKVSQSGAPFSVKGEAFGFCIEN